MLVQRQGRPTNNDKNITSPYRTIVMISYRNSELQRSGWAGESREGFMVEKEAGMVKRRMPGGEHHLKRH